MNSIHKEININNTRELLAFSLPLMLSIFSINIMIIVDRLILANYSGKAMNAVAMASSIISIFIFFGVAITSLSEVFVGQNYGAKKFHLLANSVWQMMWFSMFYGCICGSLIYIFSPYLLVQEMHQHGLSYIRICISLVFIIPMNAALKGYFIAQGRTRIIIVTDFLSNILNFILAILLVFGCKGFIVPLGSVGAAIATTLACILNFSILFLAFFTDVKKVSSIEYIDRKVMRECLFLGFPSAVSHSLEMIAWYCILQIFTLKGEKYISFYVFLNSLFLGLLFINEGISKSIIALVSNYLGKSEIYRIKNLIFYSIKLGLIIFSLLLLIFIFFVDSIFYLYSFFIKNSKNIVFSKEIYISLGLFGIFFILDFFAWIAGSILIAYRQTKTVMYINSFNIWFFCVFPLFIIYILDIEINLCFVSLPLTFYSLFNFLFMSRKLFHIIFYRNVLTT